MNGQPNLHANEFSSSTQGQLLIRAGIFAAGVLVGCTFGYALRPVPEPGKTAVPLATQPAISSPAQSMRGQTHGAAVPAETEAEASPKPASGKETRVTQMDEARAAIAAFTTKFQGGNAAGNNGKGAAQALMVQLARLGPAGLDAIKEFLATGQDVKIRDGWSLGGGDVSSPSLRLEMIKGLTLFGEDALPLQSSLIDETSSMTEAAVLAKQLETAAPGQYKDKILSAMREILADPSSKSPNDWPATALAVEMVRHFQAYDMMPTLVQQAEKSNGMGVYAFQGILHELPPDLRQNLTLQLLDSQKLGTQMAQAGWMLSSLDLNNTQISSRVATLFATKLNENQKEEFLRGLSVTNQVFGGGQLFDSDRNASFEKQREAQASRAEYALSFLPQIVPYATTPVLQQRLKEAQDALRRAIEAKKSSGQVVR